jgi:type I restriction enzyme S subunit
MNQAKMNSIPVALPPEPEQRRIVVKASELLQLCEELATELGGVEQLASRSLQASL